MRILLACCLLLPAAGVQARGRKKSALPDAASELAKAASPDVTSYMGELQVQVLAPQPGPARLMAVRFQAPRRYRREVLDVDGNAALLVVSDGETEWIYDKGRGKVWEGEAVDPDARQLGLDDELELIQANYDAVIATGPKVAKRATWVVELRSKADHRLRKRLWLDRKTGLTLQSQDFLPDGTMSSEMAFTKVTFSRRQKEAAFHFKMPKGVAVVKRLQPDYLAVGQAKSASGMDPKLPAWLPSGYVFESLDVLPRGGRKIIHYRFSDGVNVLSLFQCPPRVRLDFGSKPGQSVTLSSGSGTLEWTNEGEVLAWSSGADKFVLIGPVGSSDMKKIADSIR